MVKCPKCGKTLEADDYIVDIENMIPLYFTIASKATPISCKHCDTLLGFKSG
jgi:ribosomal protein S27E